MSIELGLAVLAPEYHGRRVPVMEHFGALSREAIIALTGREAGMEEPRFGRLMERFAEVSQRITTAWSRVEGLKGFILHDDLTMTSGPIFPPRWYRQHIFPHYRPIFQPLIDKAIPIIFTSDGDCSVFVEDIFDAGAEELNFEHCVDLETLVDRYPDKILVGNMNSDILARGTPIRRQRRRPTDPRHPRRKPAPIPRHAQAMGAPRPAGAIDAAAGSPRVIRGGFTGHPTPGRAHRPPLCRYDRPGRLLILFATPRATERHAQARHPHQQPR